MSEADRSPDEGDVTGAREIEMAEMLRRGHSQVAIGRRFGLTKQRVGQILLSRGLMEAFKHEDRRECGVCGAPFLPRNRRHVHCSPRCRQKAAKPKNGAFAWRAERVCGECGAAYLPWHSRQRYCGRRCKERRYMRDYQRRRAAAGGPEPR